MSTYTFTPEALNRYAIVTKAAAGEEPEDFGNLAVIGWSYDDGRLLPVVLDPQTWTGILLRVWLAEHPEFRLLRLRRGKTEVEVSGSLTAWTGH